MKNSDSNQPQELEAIENLESIESCDNSNNPDNPDNPDNNECPRLYTEAEMMQMTQDAYLRGRNEQIESRFVADTSTLDRTDGKLPPALDDIAGPRTDGTWIHTRSSVWQ